MSLHKLLVLHERQAPTGSCPSDQAEKVLVLEEKLHALAVQSVPAKHLLWLPALLSHCCICRVGGTLLLLYFCFSVFVVVIVIVVVVLMSLDLVGNLPAEE